MHSPIAAKAYYIGPSGSDSASGSFYAPWRSLAKANDVLKPGDTAYVNSGLYAGANAIQWTASGTADKPIVITTLSGARPSAGGTGPIFDGGGANWFLITAAHDLVIEGLEITHYGLWGIQVSDSSSNVTIRSCYLHGILAADNAAIVTRQCRHVVIENSVFEEMGRSLAQTAFDHAVYNSDGGHDITIRNNLFKNNYGGPAINHYHDPAPYDVSIYNNVFVMTKGAERSAIYSGGLAHDIRIYNNTFYLDGTGATKTYGITLNSGAGTNAVKNNIFHFVASDIQDALIGTDGEAVDYNLYFPAKDSDDSGSHSSSGDPLFKNAGSDFHLTAASPARGSATELALFATDFDGKPRPAGAWDKGAFQFTEGTSILMGGGGKRSADKSEAGAFYGLDGRWIPTNENTDHKSEIGITVAPVFRK